MERTSLLTRAEINCLDFVRNLALSNATREQRGAAAIRNNFWSQISRNALDLAVLDWCHAFGQQNDALHWKNVFSAEQAAFRTGMLSWMEIPFDDFKQFWEYMKAYRDKDLAHLELRTISMIPAMEKAIDSMTFYYHEVQHAKQQLGMYCRVESLYHWYEAAYAGFDKQAAMAFESTETPRGPDLPKRRPKLAVVSVPVDSESGLPAAPGALNSPDATGK